MNTFIINRKEVLSVPKILDQPKEKMTEAAREILLNEGYKALTIRRIASVCNTGVGTVYNYYSSKDTITAAVMLKDWKAITDELARSLDRLEGIDGIEAIFNAVRNFSLIYSKVWAEYKDKGRLFEMPYHGMIVKEIMTYADRFIDQRLKAEDPFLERFVSETVLRFAADLKTDFSDIKQIINKLIN